jgi:hypothetical protein
MKASSESEMKQPLMLWKVWKAASKLEEKQESFYPTITPRVVKILRGWGSTWEDQEGWKSLLDKHSLVDEVEESIIAIYHLFDKVSPSDQRKYIAADVCGGKGLFSFLLSYFKPTNIDSIILLEKANIDWYHIHEANRLAEQEGRPIIEIWEKTNLHDYDDILDRFLNLPHPIAMTGIHLCKQLGPSFCGLVNGLGQRCIYACLAPCCLPRAITSQKANPHKVFSVSIQMEESAEVRRSRRKYMERRERLKRKPSEGPCYFCKDPNHNLVKCPELPTLPKEEQTRIRQAWHVATIPCWNCLEFGHYKNECPKARCSSNRLSQQPPTISLNVSNVLQDTKPYTTYCYMLATAIQNRQCQVIKTELDNQGKHQTGNWNSERKSIYIFAK